MTMKKYRKLIEPTWQRRGGTDTKFYPSTETEATDQHNRLLKMEGDAPISLPRVTIYHLNITVLMSVEQIISKLILTE